MALGEIEMSKKIIYGSIVLLIIIAGTLGIWYYASHHNVTKLQTPPSQNQTGSTSQPQTQQPAKTYPVSVYFSKHPDSDNDPSKTFPVKRVSPDLGVASFAIAQLLKGPTSTELAQGYFATAHLRAGTANSDFRLNIANVTATLQFLKPFDHLGVVADGQADSEIKSTLKQFSTVKKVIILNYRGNCEFDLSGMNLCKE